MTETILRLLTRLSEAGDDAILPGELAAPFFGPVFDRLLAKRVLVEQAPLADWEVCDACECGLPCRPIRKAGDGYRAECPLDRRHDVDLTEDDLRVFRIGGGALVNGRLLHGLLHPEMGHMGLKRDPNLDPFPGSCPYHGDCWEGLASGPALEKRWGQKGQTLPLDHPGWALQANYIAQALVNTITILSPQRIILGGGVMGQAHLFPMIREQVKTLLNGYVQSRTILEGLDGYIVPPGLGSQAGVMGAIALAMDAAG